MKILLQILGLTLFLSTALAAIPSKVSEADATYKDIKQTLGIVPSFLRDFPQDAIAASWDEMKNLELNNKTVLNGKYKELIGLAVASQIPCRFCTYFHTKAAKLNQATPEEIKDAVAIAGVTRRWSTILNGSQTNMEQFKSEVDQMMKFGQDMKNREAMEDVSTTNMPKPITTAAEAYEDMKLSMGLVPTFVQNYPAASVAGAWKEFKAVLLNPNSRIPPKMKELVGLAVSAQIPCDYCVYYHTQSAVTAGATKEEISEAIGMAGTTRLWSTVLNGNYTDERKFVRETDQVMKFLKDKAAKTVTQF